MLEEMITCKYSRLQRLASEPHRSEKILSRHLIPSFLDTFQSLDICIEQKAL